MNIAQLYPARRQADGKYWYRNGGGDGSWSPSREFAHADYQCIVCFGHPSRCDCPDGPTHPDANGLPSCTPGAVAIPCAYCDQYGHPSVSCPTLPPITTPRGGVRYGTPCAWCDTVHDGGPEKLPRGDEHTTAHRRHGVRRGRRAQLGHPRDPRSVPDMHHHPTTTTGEHHGHRTVRWTRPTRDAVGALPTAAALATTADQVQPVSAVRPA